MGTINCVVNSDQTFTFTSISGTNPPNTWARLHGPVFEIFGGGTFHLAFSVITRFSHFRFDTSDPIDWGGSQPSWIQIDMTNLTATELTLVADSSQANGNSTFTIRNTGTGASPLQVTIISKGGSGGANGTIEAYVESEQTALIGPLPAGALATGSDVSFGFRDSGGQQIVFSPATGLEIETVNWTPSKPDFVEVQQMNGQTIILIDNVVGTPLVTTHSSFTLVTDNVGSIDPTIVTNPEETGPKFPGARDAS